MRIAFAAAAKGKPRPNPKVGCVIEKNGKIVGLGYHKKAGKAHAEINALKEAAEKARNATMHVTLEPCIHYGKTAPCVPAIINAGIKKVVVGGLDPNPIVKGKGIALLRRAGIEVEVSEEEKIRKMNEFFIKFISSKKPFVALKMAMSLDGKVACNSGQSKWISSKQSRQFVQKLRDKYDAVLVGSNTVLLDNPLLSCRIKGGRNPIKVFVDSELKIPLNANVFKGGNVIVATTAKAAKEKIKQIRERGYTVLITKRKKGKVDLNELMTKLASLGIISVLVEGGPTIATALINEKLVDKVLFFIAPKIIGGKNAITPVEGKGIDSLEKAIALDDISVKRFKSDVLIEACVKRK